MHLCPTTQMWVLELLYPVCQKLQSKIPPHFAEWNSVWDTMITASLQMKFILSTIWDIPSFCDSMDWKSAIFLRVRLCILTFFSLSHSPSLGWPESIVHFNRPLSVFLLHLCYVQYIKVDLILTFLTSFASSAILFYDIHNISVLMEIKATGHLIV